MVKFFQDIPGRLVRHTMQHDVPGYKHLSIGPSRLDLSSWGHKHPPRVAILVPPTTPGGT